MIRRRRPLLRAAVVGGGAYAAGRHMANKQAEQQYQESEQDARLSSLEQQQQGGYGKDQGRSLSIITFAGFGGFPSDRKALGEVRCRSSGLAHCQRRTGRHPCAVRERPGARKTTAASAVFGASGRTRAGPSAFVLGRTLDLSP